MWNLLFEIVNDAFGHEEVHAEQSVEAHEDAHDGSEQRCENDGHTVHRVGDAVEACFFRGHG